MTLKEMNKVFNLITIAFLILLVLAVVDLFSQTPVKTEAKQTSALRIQEAPKIDGIMDEVLWSKITPAGDFIQYEPENGSPATQGCLVRFAYDDEALYVAAFLTETSRDSIWSELSRRDEDSPMAETFRLVLNPYNDGINASEFRVTAAGVQSDCRNSSDNLDFSWNAVWKSAVSIGDKGWTVEMKIPFSALRFPETQVQNWQINMWRTVKRRQEQSSWNFVDKKHSGSLKQSGMLGGISNIQPPVRLSVSPYVSGRVEKNPGKKAERYFNGGMDLKYGINESFTLDMMLVPDFGQVQSDDAVLNLSSVETRFDERRQFFTEGSELFSKANLFYSRRIGSRPAGYYDVYGKLNGHEVVKENPAETQIINSTKLSGRTKDGLGIGVFNAVTSNTYAEVMDTTTGARREIMTQPFTNYNILAFDKSLPNNSYLSFVNTNLYRPSTGYSANVTGTQFLLATEEQNYDLYGQGSVSQIYNRHKSPDLGFTYQMSFSKISGNFRFGLTHIETNEKYNRNDMGYIGQNNEFINMVRFEYNFLNPVGIFLRWNNQIRLTHSSLYAPRKYSQSEIYIRSEAVLKNNSYVEFDLSIHPTEKYDYFEPRVWGKKYAEPPDYYYGIGYSTGGNKKNSLYAYTAYWTSETMNKETYWLYINPRFRISDRFRLNIWMDNQYLSNATGFVTVIDPKDDIIFGRRNILTISNTIEGAYNLNANTSLNLRLRHYSSVVKYKEFYTLLDDGHFRGRPDYAKNEDISFNSLTMDVVFTWLFSAGSEFSVVWKNALYENSDKARYNYFDNLDRTFNSPRFSSILCRVLYYFDFHAFH